MYQGKPRRRAGERTIPVIACSFDEFDYEPQWLHHSNPVGSPEDMLADAGDLREACIQAMYEVIYDLVANQMNLERRHRYTAHKDAEIFQYTLRGYGPAAIMHELGIAERTANQRIQLARERLVRFLAEHGLSTVASKYAEMITQDLLDGGRRAIVEQEVAQQQAAHIQKYGIPPAKRTVHTWTAKAHTRWNSSVGGAFRCS